MGSDLEAAGDERAAHAGPRSALRRRHVGRAGHVLRGPGAGEAGARARGTLAPRRGDARRALGPLAADVDRRHLLRAARRLPRAGRPAGARTSGPPPPSRWCSPLPVASLYPGICRVHQAGMLQLQGAWEEAEAEALAACDDMVRIDVFAVAGGWYEVGEVRRRAAISTAPTRRTGTRTRSGATRSPASRCCASRRDVSTRRRMSIAAAIAAFGGSRLERAPLHAAQVDISLAAGDLDTAATSADEVTETARLFESVGLRAVGLRVQGASRSLAVRASLRRLTARRVHSLERARRALRGRADPRAPRRTPTHCSTTTTPPTGSGPRHAVLRAPRCRRRAAARCDGAAQATASTRTVSAPASGRCSSWLPGA